MRRLLPLLAVVCASACHAPDAGPCDGLGCDLPPDLVQVTVSPAKATIYLGYTITLVDTITNNPTNATFTPTWSSADATKASVDSTGRVTGEAVTPGVAICATVRDLGYEETNCATVAVEVAQPANGARRRRP